MTRVKDTDRGYRKLMARIGALGNVAARVGVRGEDGEDLVTIAAANEFGTATIPERSFLRSTVDEGRAKYAKLLRQAVERMVDGVPVPLAMGVVGETLVGDVQRKIRNRIPPPNAPSTIARKGSDVPLIDTGRLRQSIDYELEVVK
jgi:hypothetical protein